MENDDRKKDPHFIREIVKEKKNRKKTILKVLFILVVAVGIAAVAAVVFAFTYHGVSDSLTSDKKSETVSSSSSEEEKSELQSTSSVSQATSSSSSYRSEETKNELTIEDYNKLRSEFRSIAQEGNKSLVTITGISSSTDYFNEPYESEKTGIGLILSETSDEYHILTYSSVLTGAEKIKASFSENSYADGTILKSDADTGLAVITVDKSEISDDISEKFEPANLSSSFSCLPGDMVIVIGNPDGYDNYMAFGAITSSTNTTSCYDNEYRVLTTDIPEGASGFGIILDTTGRVIGITSPCTDSISDTTITALSVADAGELIDDLSQNKGRAYIGIKGYDVTEKISQESGIPEGVIAVSLAENSPALMSGMMEYDIITSFDGNEVRTMTQFSKLIKTYDPGTPVAVSVLRQTGTEYVPVELTIELGEV